MGGGLRMVQCVSPDNHGLKLCLPVSSLQENGHVKINGDLSPKADGEAAPINGNGSAEPVKEEPKVEVGSGDAIEPAPVAEGGENKPDGTDAAASSKETPKKKKKRFSFKKSFKLSGISFRKAKKESTESSAVASPTEEQGKEEPKSEEDSACAAGEPEPASATKEEAPQENVVAVAEASVMEAEREETSVELGKEEEKQQQQQQPRETTQEDTKLEETSKPAEVDPSPAPVAPEQNEE